jgi:hypothetical protein
VYPHDESVSLPLPLNEMFPPTKVSYRVFLPLRSIVIVPFQVLGCAGFPVPLAQ